MKQHRAGTPEHNRTESVGASPPGNPDCRLLPAVVTRGFPTTVAPACPHILERHPYNGSVGLPTQLRLVLLPNAKDQEREEQNQNKMYTLWYIYF